MLARRFPHRVRTSCRKGSSSVDFPSSPGCEDAQIGGGEPLEGGARHDAPPVEAGGLGAPLGGPVRFRQRLRLAVTVPERSVLGGCLAELPHLPHLAAGGGAGAVGFVAQQKWISCPLPRAPGL